MVATSIKPHPAQAGITVVEGNGTAIVRIAGDVDLASADVLDATLRRLAERPHGRVIVDLSAVSFMDTAGLRALVRARERMDSAGRWLLTRGATGQPRRLLEIGRVHYGLTL